MINSASFRPSVYTNQVRRPVRANDDGDTKTKPVTKPPVRTVPAEPLPSQKPASTPCTDPDKSGCEF